MGSSDFLVIGAGVVGVSVALSLKRRFTDASIQVIDKELQPAAHSSGRNSGVLHAGFYYTADTLKAKFTKQGNELLTRYCDERKLPINKCGKIVVTQTEDDFPQLDELFRRAKANGSVVQEIDKKEAMELEPRIKTMGRALWSPQTSTIDPTQVLVSLIRDAEADGIRFSWGERYLNGSPGEPIRTSQGLRKTGYLVNAAGLYADKVARDHGFGENYRILPFKGLYLYSNEPVGAFKRHIYPVPNLQQPFLGVHFTQSVTGQTKIGPTAIPAFWREQYKGFENFNLREFVELCLRQTSLVAFADFDFAKLARQELLKYSRTHLVNIASRLAEGVRPDQFTRWGRAGIRAQLYDIKKRRLEMDFKLEGDRKSFHVLNAISPGFTCALPFADLIVQEIDARLSKLN